MNNIKKTAVIIYSCCLSIAFFPFLALLCAGIKVNFIPIFLEVFLLSLIAIFLNRLTPRKYIRFFSKVYTLIITVSSFFFKL